MFTRYTRDIKNGLNLTKNTPKLRKKYILCNPLIYNCNAELGKNWVES